MKAFLPAAIWAAVILLLTTMNANSFPKAFDNMVGSDKLAHAAVFGLLTALILWGLKKQGHATSKMMLLAPVISSIYGLAIEFAQLAFFPHRHFELFDIIANIIGSFGIWLVFLFTK